ncbi:cleavage and polyadenylation specificity factor subunit 2 [Limosa lapponica baueri]|uniref:Cleavage and polyadenylation specificity factor subunit 2 n=1 Tax=Limosa lapponica baueri TaxID=1758121 RepID=A0A2I0TQL1_LIMLA|nr:cleavage and polyadenylation specificity factor subunit 2 [Limosa lapponica baueri]
MAGANGRRLRPWLVAQAWAEFKGRLRPGVRPDPASCKTRLRCALNKSSELQEVPERSRLEGPRPYKVYQLLTLPQKPGGSCLGLQLWLGGELAWQGWLPPELRQHHAGLGPRPEHWVTLAVGQELGPHDGPHNRTLVLQLEQAFAQQLVNGTPAALGPPCPLLTLVLLEIKRLERKMTSIIKLTTLSGVQEESALCYLLQVDEFRFLLDCGWDENFSMDIIDSLRKHVHQVDAVLLSHPDPLHLGALPYAVGKMGLNCAIYATIPVYKMGQMFMYDLYQSRHNTEDFTLFTLDDVDAAFDKIQQLKFSQIVNLKGKGHGLSITPLPAGHMIGGTIWKIVKDGEEEIVYAVDFNHKREIHLNGCSLEMLSRPSLLITDSFNATYVQPRRKQRDEQLLTNVLETLRGDGNVLIAVDTAGRVLELAQLLDQIWRTKDAGLGVYSLALLNNVSYNVVEFSKSQVEWMSDKLMRCFEDKRNNPFQFRHLSLCHSLSDLARVSSPKVVLASQPDLECGFSRDLFIQWCQDSKNSIILTYRTTPGTLARFLIDNPSEKVIDIELRKRVKLEGKELEEYLEKEKLKKEAAKKLEQSKEADIDSSDESDAEEDIDQPTVHKTKHDLMMKGEGSRKGSFFKQAKKSYPMFPAPEERIKWDEYGEIIKPEDFLVPELQATEEEKSKLESGLTNGEEPMDQDLSDVPTKCISAAESMEIK